MTDTESTDAEDTAIADAAAREREAFEAWKRAVEARRVLEEARLKR